MIKKVLFWTAIGIAVTFVLLWILSGGIGKVIQQAKFFMNPFSSGEESTSTRSGFHLPWQPLVPVGYVGPDTAAGGSNAGSNQGSNSQTTSSNPQDELSDIQAQYDALQQDIKEAQEFGTPSPYRDQVYLTKKNAAKSMFEEYVTITAQKDNTAPIDVTGWSLQSAVTGVRAYIPRGSAEFLMGAVNAQGDIQLSPGAVGTVASGASPVGTSFRENLCTGYLNQFQTFNPTLTKRCPAPTDTLPLTADNINMYGDACIDFVKKLSSCYSPIQNFTPALSDSCKNYLSYALSYNGCVERYRYRSDFSRQDWRVFLNASQELWRNTHDIIRLLDRDGRTVDALTY